MTTTVTVPLTIDATIAQDSADNHGKAQFLSVYTGTTDARRILVHGARSFPLGARIISSKVRARQQAVATSASRTLPLRLVTEKWGESTVKWPGPGTSTTAEASVTVTGAGSVGRVIEWDVLAMTQLISQGTPFFGFRIHSLSTSLLRLFSQESGQGLEWEVTYSTTPPAPTLLSPSAGRAVSVARPVLSFGSADARGGAISAFQVQLFSGETASLIAPTTPMSARFASFNVNGITSSPQPWGPRLNGLAQTIVNSGAKSIALQEISRDQVDQPALLLAKVKELSGRNTWAIFVGPNLNAILVDTAAFTPQWPITRDKGLGDGKWASGMLLKDVATDELITHVSTHFLPGDENAAKRAAATRVLITWAATLGPRVISGDLNTASKAADKPLNLLALAAHVEVRTLVDTVTNGTYNSLDGYGTNPMQGVWIDHQLVADGPRVTAVGLVDSGSSSDHNLVWSDVELSTSTAVVGDLGAPTFDTGERAGVIAQWQVEHDIEVDELVLFRARVFRGGEWSEWSDAAPFTRKLKPTLTLVNPAAAPNDFVTESTPPFIAELSAGVQTAYRVMVTDPIDHTLVYWDTKRQGGPDLTVRPSPELGLISGNRYRLEWQSEDDVPREATPGDPIAVIAEREFTFELSTTKAPVTSLGPVFQADERPWMTVPFTMSEAPDAVEVLRRPVTDNPSDPPSPLVSLGVFDAADLHLTGTSYAFVDRRVPGRQKFAWVVRRIVDGVTSANNPNDVGAVEVSGVWIVSEDGSRAFVVSESERGGEVIKWDVDEDVELHRPIGGRVVRPVTRSIFGRAGDLSGTVEPWGDLSIVEVRATVNSMRPPVAPYGTPMILTQVDECVRFLWVGVLPSPLHEFYNEFDIAAEIHEIPDGAS